MATAVLVRGHQSIFVLLLLRLVVEGRIVKGVPVLVLLLAGASRLPVGGQVRIEQLTIADRIRILLLLVQVGRLLLLLLLLVTRLAGARLLRQVELAGV